MTNHNLTNTDSDIPRDIGHQESENAVKNVPFAASGDDDAPTIVPFDNAVIPPVVPENYPRIVPGTPNTEEPPPVVPEDEIANGHDTDTNPCHPEEGNQKDVILGQVPRELTPEMRQWLSDNREDYEFYLLHALLHDPLWRMKMISTPVVPNDFLREEYALVMGAMIGAVKVTGVMNFNLPTPPDREFMRTYIEVVARKEGSDDEVVEGSLQLIDALQDPKYKEEHYTIAPYYEAWYGSVRAKLAAREINAFVIPDVRSVMDKLENEIYAASQITGSLDGCEFDFDNEPEALEPILKLGEHPICTAGNISNIGGPPKAGKTAVVEAMLAAVIREPWLPPTADTLGFEAVSEGAGAILHIDTEQSKRDHHLLVQRAYKRANRKEKARDLRSFLLAGQEPETCLDFLMRKLDEVDRTHDGVKLVILDGIADFCRDPNDAETCFDLLRKLHRVALDYNCAVITVLHENPGSISGKHAVTWVAKWNGKAETMLRLTKDVKTGMFSMWTERARHCFIPQKAAMRFEWDDEKKMHLSSDQSAEVRKVGKDVKFAEEVNTVFRGREKEALSYTDLWERISDTIDIAESTAKGRVSDYIQLGLVEKDDEKKYRLSEPQPVIKKACLLKNPSPGVEI